MASHHSYQAEGGASNSQEANPAWNNPQRHQSGGSNKGSYTERPDVHHYQANQYNNAVSAANNPTFQNYDQQVQAQYQHPMQHGDVSQYPPANQSLPGAGGGYWAGNYQQMPAVGAYNTDQSQAYPNCYDDPSAGLWTGTAGDLYSPGLGAEGAGVSSPPDLFSSGTSLENSGASAVLQSINQPDMLPQGSAIPPEIPAVHDVMHHNDTENSTNQPPDMLLAGGYAAPSDQMEEPVPNAEVENSVASGPDILSNGMRGDERTRPDILSPAREDSVPTDVVSDSRSSSVVLHSPNGAFEPVRSSASRSGSLSETEAAAGQSAHHPQNTNPGITAAPLWEHPNLPNVQLHPAGSDAASLGAPMPVHVLPTQVLQSMGAEALLSSADSHAAAVDDETHNVADRVSNLSLSQTGNAYPNSQSQAQGAQIDASVSAADSQPGLVTHCPDQPLTGNPPKLQQAQVTLTSGQPAMPNQQNFVPIQPSPGVVSAEQPQWPPSNSAANQQLEQYSNMSNLGQGQTQNNMNANQSLPGNNVQQNQGNANQIQQSQSNIDQGQQYQGSMGQGQQNQGIIGQGQQNQGSIGQGQQNQGSMGQGQQNYGNMSQGQQNQGNMGQGQQNYGNMNQGQQNQMQMFSQQQNPMMSQGAFATPQQNQQYTNPMMVNQMNYGMMQQQQPGMMTYPGMNPAMMPNPAMQQPGMIPNQYMNSGVMGFPQGFPHQYPSMVNNQQQMYPGQNPSQFANDQQPGTYNQMDPQMQQRMAMMKGFKPLTQQQLGHQSTNSQSRHGYPGQPNSPIRALGPMVGQHPQQGYGRQPRTQPNNAGYYQYSSDQRMTRNQSFGSYRGDDSSSSYRDEDLSYGRPRSRDAYEERRGYGYGSRPSSRTGSRPSSRAGSGAPGLFQSEVNPYLSQSGFSPRPPSRTSSRLDSVYRQSQAESSDSDSSDSEPAGAGRMTPAKFPLPHLVPRLLTNGDTLEVQAHYPDDGQPATVLVVRRHLHQPSLIKFPGPLVKGQTHKRDVLDYCTKMSTAAGADSSLIDRDSTVLLWRFLHLLVKQNGTYLGSDIAELLLDGYNMDSELYAVRSQAPSGGAKLTEQELVDRFRQLVMFGNTKEALEWAMSSGLWGHALFLSSKMSSRIHAQVLTRFANTSMTYNDPLQTLYQLMSSRQPSAATHPDDGWSSWRPHLAMMLCNPSEETQLNIKAMTSLGDTLAAKGLLHASHFCYLMADHPLEPHTKKSAKLSLLGIATGVPLDEYNQESATEMSEVYEYAQSLAGSTVVLPHLQICKFFHVRRLLDRGQPTEALAYLEAINSRVSGDIDLFSYAFISQLHSMAEQLTYFDAEAVYVRDGRSLDVEWITKLGETLQQKLAKVSCAPMPTSQLEVTDLTQEVPQHSPSAPTELPYNNADSNQDGYGYQPTHSNDTGYAYQPTQPHDQADPQTQAWPGAQPPDQTDTGQGYPQHPDSQQQSNQWVQPAHNDYSSAPASYSAHQGVQQFSHVDSSQSYGQQPEAQLSGQQHGGQWAQPSQYDENAGLSTHHQNHRQGDVSSQPVAAEPATDYYDYKPPMQSQAPPVAKENAGLDTNQSKTEKSTVKNAPSKAGGGFGFGLGSLFSKILPKSKNEVKLPDDSKQTIVWDDKLKKWVDTESDGTEEVKAAPPPTDTTLGRPSPSQLTEANSSGAPAPPSQAGNVYSLKRSRGAKYVDVMGKAVGTSLSPIPQHLFDVTPRSTPTSSIFTPTPTTDPDEGADSEPNPTDGSNGMHTRQLSNDQPAHQQPTHHQPHSWSQQHQQQQQRSAYQPQPQDDSQMPRNDSMASLEVQNIMRGPSYSRQAPPTSHQAPPTSHQAPPTSHQTMPVNNTQAPPSSQPPANDASQSGDTGSVLPSKPPLMFNPNQFKAPLAAPGGRLASRNRYPK